MKVTINIIELASELANMDLENNWGNSIMIYEDDNEVESIYTQEAQDIFNDLYDKYYSLIENCQVNNWEIYLKEQRIARLKSQ
jgi:hypothetical protein